MAKDVDSGEIVVSSVRTGMKREFAMMMKAQSEMGCIFEGRRRVTRSQNTSKDDLGSDKKGSGVKRRKKGADSASKSARKKLDVTEVLDNEEESKGVVEVRNDVGEELKVQTENVASGVEERKSEEAEAMVVERKDDVVPLPCKDSSMTRIGGNKVESGSQEASASQMGGNVVEAGSVIDKSLVGTSGLGCGRMSEKMKGCVYESPRRFTRSQNAAKDGNVSWTPCDVKRRKKGVDSPSKNVQKKLDVEVLDNVEESKFVIKVISDVDEELKVSEKNRVGGVEERRNEEAQNVVIESKDLGQLPCKDLTSPQNEGNGLLESESEKTPAFQVQGNQVEYDNSKDKSLVGTSRLGGEKTGEMTHGVSQKPMRRFTRSMLKVEEEVVDIGNGQGASTPVTSPSKLEMKMSKKVELKSIPTKLKESESSPSSSSSQSLSMKLPPQVSSSSMLEDMTKRTDQKSSSNQTRTETQGRLTRKDLKMHKLVFEDDVLPEGTALTYYVHGQKLNSGYKSGLGIFCYHCNQVVSASKFEAHAGCASRRKPYHSIYTSNGVSLHELSLRLSSDRMSSEENDDLCSKCKDGGDLLCCDSCPRAFHPACVKLPCVPEGSWHCSLCTSMFEMEKYAERNPNAIAAGRVAGIDPLEEIARRCIRVVEVLQTADAGGCAICSGHHFSKSGFNDRTVIICDQCEKEYHVGCLREQNMQDLKGLPEGKWFCCADCSNIHCALQQFVTDGEQRLPEALLKLLEKKCEGSGSEANGECGARWRLLCGKTAPEDAVELLSGAVNIFHERFAPISDAKKKQDLIPRMVYGRKFRETDFGGMYCAILTVNSVVVSAAIVRIFGLEVAELPLAATCNDQQGKGYFQSLFLCVEDLLQSLRVKSLVLPAADEAESLWKNKFGFDKIDKELLDQYRKRYQMMIFHDTTVLHKSLLNP